MGELRVKEASREQIRRASRLHSRAQRQRWKQTLVEGPQAVRELLTYTPELVRDFYVTERSLRTHSDIEQLASDAHVWTHPLTDADFSALSPDGQGLTAVINLPKQQSLDSVLSGAQLVMAVPHISDPGNCGTIIRVADAAGADAVLVGEKSVELYSPKTIRSTAGSLFHLPVISDLSFADICEAGHDAGLHILGADAHGHWELHDLLDFKSLSQPSSEAPPFSLNDPIMWVLGNEARGFADFDTRLLDTTVSIPIFGKAESLNVAIAGGILAYTTAMARTQQ